MKTSEIGLASFAICAAALCGCSDLVKSSIHAAAPPGVSGSAVAPTSSALSPSGTSVGTAGGTTISTVAGESSPVTFGTAGAISVRTGFYPTPLVPTPPVTLQ
jgi:hypothetical protein